MGIRSIKRLKHTRNLFRKNQPTVKRCLLILDLTSFRSYVKEKHSISKEFQSLAVWGTTVDIDILVTYRNGGDKKYPICQNNE